MSVKDISEIPTVADIGRRLAECRRARSMTHASLCEMAAHYGEQITPYDMSRWELGKNAIKISSFLRLAFFLRVAPSHILADEERWQRYKAKHLN